MLLVTSIISFSGSLPVELVNDIHSKKAVLSLKAGQERKTIHNIIMTDPRFRVFLTTAILKTPTNTQLIKDFSDCKNTFTVFLPSKEALAKVPAGDLPSLLASPSLLARHVVRDTALPTEEIAPGTALHHSAAGGRLALVWDTEVQQFSVRTGEASATVTLPDILACNGVIHQVDSFLLGDTTSSTTPTTTTSTTNTSTTNTSTTTTSAITMSSTTASTTKMSSSPSPAAASLPSCSSLLASLPQFSILASLRPADIFSLLDDSEPFTLFAPTNTAFNKIPVSVRARLQSAGSPLAALLLQRHSVQEELLQGGQIAPGQTRRRSAAQTWLTLQRQPSHIQVSSDHGRGHIVMFDLFCGKGIVHAVDVLL